MRGKGEVASECNMNSTDRVMFCIQLCRANGMSKEDVPLVMCSYVSV